ncbi:hypothetical protein BJV78DRAFT_1222806 [Lactifluus subvellereus]|nr:hypothetical protein BJV78DRAFT_1222806 [Lactifluus subvellereus]
MSPSFPPATVPGHTPPAELYPFSSSLPSQFDQTPLATAASPQGNPDVVDTDAPTLVGAHQTAQSGPEIATDVSLSTAPSPRDVGRSR